jgi:dihydrofolate synthase/folylpolyglutamate synthase
LPIADEAYQSLQSLTLPGRFQTIAHSPELVLDVAHNPAAAELLAEQLKLQPISGRNYALFAMMADKDIAAVLSALKSSFDGWFVAGLPDVSRALSVSDLLACLKNQGIDNIHSAASVAESYQQALAVLNADDRLVVFGSFFTVSEIMKCHEC